MVRLPMRTSPPRFGIAQQQHVQAELVGLEQRQHSVNERRQQARCSVVVHYLRLAPAYLRLWGMIFVAVTVASAADPAAHPLWGGGIRPSRARRAASIRGHDVHRLGGGVG